MPIDKILEEEIGEVDVPYFEPEDPLERGRIQGRNNHIMLLKSRIPQIKERILGEIEKLLKQQEAKLDNCNNVDGRVQHECFKRNHRVEDWNEIVRRIINTLKGGNK